MLQWLHLILLTYVIWIFYLNSPSFIGNEAKFLHSPAGFSNNNMEQIISCFG
jgi:hypothetical protein